MTLFTVGQGDHVWELFGHNAILIRDTLSGFEVAYNYGLFDFNQTDFITRFLRGEMMYWMAGLDARAMLGSYAAAGRPVWFQELNLSAAQKEELRRFLAWNALPENRFYRYDYFRDNCSTRVRDALDRVLGGEIRRQTEDEFRGVSWRFHTRRLTAPSFVGYHGIQLLLGPRGDASISRWDEMYVPTELQTALRSVTVPSPSGEPGPLVLREGLLVPSSRLPERSEPPPFNLGYPLFGVLLAMLTVVGSVASRRGSRAGRWVFGTVTAGWGLSAGVTGVVLALVWGTDHVFMYWNQNILLFSPLALGLVFLGPAAARGPRGVSAPVAPPVTRPPRSRRALRVLAWLLLTLAVVALLLKGIAPQGNGEWLALALPFYAALAWAAGSGTSASTRNG